jgi:hypothetical protein
MSKQKRKSVLEEMNREKHNNNDYRIDKSVLGIDTGIKAGNPDHQMIEESLRTANNNQSLFLKLLLMKVHNFEMSILCYKFR